MPAAAAFHHQGWKTQAKDWGLIITWVVNCFATAVQRNQCSAILYIFKNQTDFAKNSADLLVCTDMYKDPINWAANFFPASCYVIECSCMGFGARWEHKSFWNPSMRRAGECGILLEAGFGGGKRLGWFDSCYLNPYQSIKQEVNRQVLGILERCRNFWEGRAREETMVARRWSSLSRRGGRFSPGDPLLLRTLGGISLYLPLPLEGGRMLTLVGVQLWGISWRVLVARVQTMETLWLVGFLSKSIISQSTKSLEDIRFCSFIPSSGG